MEVCMISNMLYKMAYSGLIDSIIDRESEIIDLIS
jgi:hypothetical protein